jgi:hypothetical protein
VAEYELDQWAVAEPINPDGVGVPPRIDSAPRLGRNAAWSLG